MPFIALSTAAVDTVVTLEKPVALTTQTLHRITQESRPEDRGKVIHESHATARRLGAGLLTAGSDRPRPAPRPGPRRGATAQPRPSVERRPPRARTTDTRRPMSPTGSQQFYWEARPERSPLQWVQVDLGAQVAPNRVALKLPTTREGRSQTSPSSAAPTETPHHPRHRPGPHLRPDRCEHRAHRPAQRHGPLLCPSPAAANSGWNAAQLSELEVRRWREHGARPFAVAENRASGTDWQASRRCHVQYLESLPAITLFDGTCVTPAGLVTSAWEFHRR